ncbi:NAD(P)/FAD-dependent oxidoreductase [Streptomyces sp. WMMB 322]|uniref:NAD(P)/FAD-dependent oxidoreductase n=1 Tax=Streptomyces sp. WMMB 322 TaxID=1286821 RepID=UPI0006E184E2|nr:FAD-dependent oxidoreductase [Streptomyces sp. WMMB 322]SCK40031.1 assimilatory nitrate reductase electron transfer subunit [Streptomyces sp. WMMB 322]
MTLRECERVVVIGGGMAGARLVQQLGAAGAHADVTVVGEEPHAPYNRVLLADVLAGQYEPDVITLPAGPARRLPGVRAVRVDRACRRVVCDDGSVLPYEALVLATGANPVLPPLRGLFTPEGGELPDGVRAFRTMDDCLALRREAEPGTQAVVVGGGLLGVSAARALARRGAQVVLAHQGERLMERQLDAGSAALLRLHLEDLGVEVHTECRVRGLLTQPRRAGGVARSAGAAAESRVVRAVELADGCILDAGLVVVACGVRPRTGLAGAAGLAVSRGIVVDDELRTDDPHVYAIGDCAEHDGVLYGLADPAQEQADVLARVLTGGTGTERYRGTRALTRLTLAGDPATTATTAGTRGPAPARLRAETQTEAKVRAEDEAPAARDPLDLAAFGDPLPRPDDDVVHLADATRGTYRKVVVRDGRLAGGILLGDLTQVGALARTWESDEPLTSEPLHHLLTRDGEALL